jgi:cell fate (sporulation/competence/biofilm development) regulator YlbF (YheA/YmcA/DUF963 family)
MGLKNKASELAEALKATVEFAELRQAKVVIDRNGSLKSEVEDLKRKQTALYSGRTSAKEAESRMTELNKAFGQLSAVPEFKKYMETSGKFNQLLQDTFKEINEAIEAGLR